MTNDSFAQMTNVNRQMSNVSMHVSVEKLRRLLVGPGHLAVADFDAAKDEAEKQKKDVVEMIMEKGLIREDQLTRLIAEAEDIPFADLHHEGINEEVFEMIPEHMARSRHIVAFRQDAEAIHIGMREPKDMETINILEKKIGKKIIAYLISQSDFLYALSGYRKHLREELDKIIAEVSASPLESEEKEGGPTIKAVEQILTYGFTNRASDIHIEPREDHALLRFRIDGVMHDILEIPRDFYDRIILRIKLISKMRIDEHLAAQDGRFRFHVEGEPVDVRVSVLPITKGENAVMRLLSSSARDFTLGSIGFSDADLTRMSSALRHPQGMILVSGPTGSGKTTTLYSVMKILNNRDVHVTTIEDPVEYDIEGVSQIQVNEKTNLSFAQGLRAIVRQDPDIIMVGEIRDRETAGIAINSALTGHLVLSTLHANDTPTTLIRFADMGIESFLIASTVHIIVGQRLVRTICMSCRESYDISMYRADEKKQAIVHDPVFISFFASKKGPTHLYRGIGCETCYHTGYTGRPGIFEVLVVDDAMRAAIVRRASRDEIRTLAHAAGTTSMLEDGVEKVKNGITTIEELLRVVSE